MKKLRLYSIFAVLIMSAGFFISCEKESNTTVEDNMKFSTKNLIQLNESSTASVNIIAGQNMVIGDLVISYDSDNIYVEYNTYDGWFMNEVQLWIGESLSEMPQTRSGNPQIGRFPYTSDNLYGESYYLFTIPIVDIFGNEPICEKMFYFVAHASVYKENSDGSIQTETGWGEGSQLTDRGSWAMYFSFIFECDNLLENPPPDLCETAYAYGDITFVDAGIGANWGWILVLENEGSYSYPLYSGAGNNNIQNGTHAGDLYVEYFGGELEVTFSMFSGFTMSETHLYASGDFPTTAAPGQYGNQNNLENAELDSYTLSFSGELPLYIIAHAVVCE